MITGELKSKIDRIWDTFWSGGISNPLEVIEQITYLLFIRRLDELHGLALKKARRTGEPIKRPIYPDGDDAKGRPYAELRWSYFKHAESREMFDIVGDHVFPFLRALGGDGSTYASHMKDARFTVPNPALLSRVVDMLDGVSMEDRDTKGDLYEYLLSKIATAGHNGQFRTPRHIIRLMVEMVGPGPDDTICDPACGSAGFLMEASEYVRREHPDLFHDAKRNWHYHHEMFHGFDFDRTMLRVGSMNMLLHGVENPAIEYRDSLAQSVSDEEEKYSVILANPPFKGSLDKDGVAEALTQSVKTTKTELLFLVLFLRLLRPGGRAAVIVPDGVLYGATKAHREIRRMLVDDHRLDAVIKLPGGVFKPYSGVSTAILFFTKTNSGGSENIWFYEVAADGLSLDDKRTPLLPEEKLGPRTSGDLSEAEHAKNNLPDVLARWVQRDGDEQKRARTEQSFCVPREEIVAGGYDLSLNRYKEIVHEDTKHRPPLEIIGDLERLESEIQQGMSDLKAMLG
ncbi:type I restriction-modification system subunit M [Dactylosporangium sp. CA-152071]|uniref:type I restriction-modification system subunit M n=1 Tax=Dactylosporangium sp. CA-152071 TaxID=3239933 RepID=UPI003D93C99D